MYDATKLNKAKVGDIVYGYYSLEELQMAINLGFKENDFCKGIRLIEIKELKPEAKFKVYDTEVDDYFEVEYVYSISDIVETRAERISRIIREWSKNNWLYANYRQEIIEAFFSLKSKGLVNDPQDEYEEFALDWSYDLQDKEDCDRFLGELQGKNLEEYVYAFLYLNADDRFVYHDECLSLLRFEDSAEMFNAVCNLTLKALNELV